MENQLIIGVMGGGSASAADTKSAYQLGALIAKQGWLLLYGGRNAGINDKQVILMNFDTGGIFDGYRARGLLFSVDTPDEVIEKIKSLNENPRNTDDIPTA